LVDAFGGAYPPDSSAESDNDISAGHASSFGGIILTTYWVEPI